MNEHTDIIELKTPAPGGFDVPTYLTSVRAMFAEKFQPDGLQARTAVFKDITFSESHDFEALDLQLPAVLLDLEGAKLNPAPGEHEHRDTSIYSNLGELELYLGMKAVVIVNNRMPDPHTLVRRLAFDVAGFVSVARRFRHPAGMSQVTHIAPVAQTRRDTTTLIAWEIRWTHSISLGEPDYTKLLDTPNVSAAQVQRVLVGFSPDDANAVRAVNNTDADGNPIADDTQTTHDESKIDTKAGYTEIYRRTPEEQT